MGDVRVVSLPADIYRAAEVKLLGKRFANLDELVCFLLVELLNDQAAQMDEAEEKIIEQRLRDLGYV